jgi:hypothetical protein
MSGPSELHAVQESLLQVLNSLSGPLSLLRMERSNGKQLAADAKFFQREAGEQKATLTPVYEACRDLTKQQLPTLRAVRDDQPVSSWGTSYPSAADAVLGVASGILSELVFLKDDALRILLPEYRRKGWTWEEFKRRRPPEDDEIRELRMHLRQEIVAATRDCKLSEWAAEDASLILSYGNRCYECAGAKVTVGAEENTILQVFLSLGSMNTKQLIKLTGKANALKLLKKLARSYDRIFEKAIHRPRRRGEHEYRVNIRKADAPQ